MKKILLSTLCIALFFIGCKTDKAKNEKAVESTSTDSISASKADTTLPTKIKFQINDEVPQALLWKNILFKLSREELQKLSGNVEGILVPDLENKNLLDIEILLVDENGKVVQTARVGKNGLFSFKKIVPGNYSIILSEKDPSIKAKLVSQFDDASIPTENSFPEHNYIVKNALKKLTKDDFLDSFNTIEILLTGVEQKNLDKLVMMILDEDGKVVEKIVMNGKNSFVFRKLPKGNYTVLIHNKNKNIKADIRILQDDSTLKIEAPLEAQAPQKEPELNTIVDKAYALKNTFRKLNREDFPKSKSKVEVQLHGDGISSFDNMVLMVLDEEGKVVEKVISNGKGSFVFGKLNAGNYNLALHNKPENIQANVKITEDAPLIVETPTVKEIPGEAEFKEGMHEYYKFNFAKALTHFHEAEKKEYPDVFNILARMYDSGEGVNLNYDKAIHYYEKGIKHGDLKANAGLGVLYLEGRGIKPDTAKSKELFHKAYPAIQDKANQGDLYWITRLGTLYNFGYGVREDYKEAAKWYAKASDKGYAFAQFNLGVMYENGLGVNQDYATALKLYQKAVDQGDVDAEFKMGVMYANGYGVPKDYAQALKWYTKAANAGYADAEYNIGVMHANGLGMEKNYPEAINWYKKAAARGFADAEYNLGVMYAKGQGVTKDNDIAVEYYKKAAKQGVEEAQKLLKKKGISWQ